MIDASALLAVVFLEDDYEAFSEALRLRYGRLYISPVNYFETWNRVDMLPRHERRYGLATLYETYPMQMVPTTKEQAYIARQARRRYGRGSGSPAKLNMGDCFAYALAKTLDEPLLFKGDDFTHTDVRSAL